MPMNDNEYKIPEGIDSRIPEYFYPAMAGELCAVYGPDILKVAELYAEDDGEDNKLSPEEYDEHPFYNLDFVTCTGGWYQALRATCKKLDMMWFYEYHSSLEFYDSDILDNIIAERIEERFIKAKEWNDSYYKYLLDDLTKVNRTPEDDGR